MFVAAKTLIDGTVENIEIDIDGVFNYGIFTKNVYIDT